MFDFCHVWRDVRWMLQHTPHKQIKSSFFSVIFKHQQSLHVITSSLIGRGVPNLTSMMWFVCRWNIQTWRVFMHAACFVVTWQGQINPWRNAGAAYVEISCFNHKWRQLKPLVKIELQDRQASPLLRNKYGQAVSCVTCEKTAQPREWAVIYSCVRTTNVFLSSLCKSDCASPPFVSLLPPPALITLIILACLWFYIFLHRRLLLLSLVFLSPCVFDLFYMSLVPLVSCPLMLTCVPVVIWLYKAYTTRSELLLNFKICNCRPLLFL